MKVVVLTLPVALIRDKEKDSSPDLAGYLAAMAPDTPYKGSSDSQLSDPHF